MVDPLTSEVNRQKKFNSDQVCRLTRKRKKMTHRLSVIRQNGPHWLRVFKVKTKRKALSFFKDHLLGNRVISPRQRFSWTSGLRGSGFPPPLIALLQ